MLSEGEYNLLRTRSLGSSCNFPPQLKLLNEPAPISSEAISTWFQADLHEQRESNALFVSADVCGEERLRDETSLQKS